MTDRCKVMTISREVKKKDSVTYSILFNYFVSYMCPLDVQIVLIKNKHLCNESYNMTVPQLMQQSLKGTQKIQAYFLNV